MKTLSRLVACVVLLSFGMSHAQEDVINVPKSNPPIEAKEQKGTVLGSLQKAINQFPIPTVTLNTGFQTKQFKRGVMWDQNTNADLDLNLSWQPTKNSTFSIGLNGRVPTRNSRRSYEELMLDEGATIDPIGDVYWADSGDYVTDVYYKLVYDIPFDFAIPLQLGAERTKDIKTRLSSKREKNELDESELRLNYSYTFKDTPVFGNITVTGGWSYFRHNDIYSKINPKYKFSSILNIKEYWEDFETFVKEDAVFFDSVVDYLDYISDGLGEQYAILENQWLRGIENIEAILNERGYEIDDIDSLPYDVRREILNQYLTDEDFNALYKEEDNLEREALQEAIEVLRESVDKNIDKAIYQYMRSDYDLYASREIKWRESSHQEFKLALSLDNVLNSNTYILNPNMSINFETTGHLWMQYGVNYKMPMEKLSKKLTWNTSMDAFWYDHDYFKVSDRWKFSFKRSKRDFFADAAKNGWEMDKEYEKQQREIVENELRMQMAELGKENSYTAHSSSGFKTLAIRTSLDYAFRPNIIISPNVSAIRYMNDLLEHDEDNEAYYFDDHYAIWCGINLLFTF